MKREITLHRGLSINKKLQLKTAKLKLTIIFLLFNIFLFSALPALASQWAKTYGGSGYDEGSAIQQTGDGGYIVAGYTQSFGAGRYDGWVLKLNADGSVAWQKTYGGSSDDYAYAIQQTGDGGYIVGGFTQSFGAGNYDAWVLKLNADGSVAWQKTYGGSGNDYANAIQQTGDGGYIVAGYTQSFGAGNYDAWVLKLNADGSVAWQKTYGGSGDGCAFAIQQTGDGGYIVGGFTVNFVAWVLKLNADGSVAWQKTYGGSGNDRTYAIQQTADGGYIMAGNTQSFGAGSYDAWALKLNADGSVAWQKTYGGSGLDYAYAIQQTADGGYIVAGMTLSFGAGENDVWVLKLDANGAIPGCSAMGISNATVNNANAIITNTNVTGMDTNVSPQTSTASVANTNATVTEICFSALEGVIHLPRTGQTKCYNTAGTEIPCAGTGQDGEIQAGVAWPDPRFEDNVDGTLTDNLTGLMWAKDAGTPTVGSCSGGPKSWYDALSYVACLNSNNYLNHNDWRLPNINELESLLKADELNLGEWLNTQGFNNVQADQADHYYWSSSNSAYQPAYAFGMNMLWMGVTFQLKSLIYYNYVLPVRGITSGPANVWKTGQTKCYATYSEISCTGTGQDGEIQAGVAWPDPRFTDNGDGTVTDNLTGLVWTQNANVPGPSSCTPGTHKTWQGALDYVKCLNTNDYLGYNDWRLPNIKELRSLIDYSKLNPALPSGHPFAAVQTTEYWSSTTATDTQHTTGALRVDMWIGQMDGISKTDSYYVWPVRGGNVVDTSPPVTTASPAGGTYNSSQSVTLTCNDASGSECATILYCLGSGCTPTTLYTGAISISSSNTLRFYSTDNAGNSETVKAEVYTINTDTIPPTGTVTINSGSAYTNSSTATLTLSCSDSESGCSQMQFSNDNANWSTPEAYVTSTMWTLTSGDGTKTVYVKFKDTPGNWSSAYSDTIILDTTAPSTTASPAGGTYSNSQSITLSCNDGSGSGCDKIYYTTDGSTPTTSSPVYSNPINISTTTTLKFFAKDLVGNQEGVKTEVYTIGSYKDTIPPSLVALSITPDTIDTSTQSQTVTVTLRITDDMAGFSTGNILFYSSSNQQHIYTGFNASNRISGNTLDGIYQVAIVFPQFSETGTWHIGNVSSCGILIIDSTNNSRCYFPNDLIVLAFPNTLVNKNIIHLPRTGQTKCYNTAGTEIPCAGTGQDGEIQAGVAWPDPRFEDNVDGTLTDNLTGLMWAKDAGTPTVGSCSGGPKSWYDALSYVACLNSNNYLNHNDWRLPNINELESLLKADELNLGEWLNTQGFNNVQADQADHYYWSSSNSAYQPAYAFGMNMLWMGVTFQLKSLIYYNYVLPVRGITSGPANVWKTGQTKCYATYSEISCTGTGQDGEIQAGVAWPDPRFTDNGDGTVTDNLTGLVWTQNANVPGPSSCTPGTHKTWQGALDYVKCLNTNDYLGYNDWRLPNIKELRSLIDYSKLNPALPSGHPFAAVQTTEYWSSTTATDTQHTTGALRVDMWIGQMDGISKTDSYYVWPVRGGTITSGVPGSSVSPASYNFGNIAVGSSSAAQTFTVTNTGLANLVIGTIALTGTDPLQFHIQNDNCSGHTVAPSGTCTVQAVFSPTSAGGKNANLSIQSNAPGSPTLVPLSGTGTVPEVFKLPDTGQTKCYQDVSPYGEIPCPVPGESLAQDGSYNINPLSYTDNGNGTAMDNDTGFMWQKQDDGNTYNWYQASGIYDATYNLTSQDVCGDLTLGGYSDWRLPSKKELMSIVDYSIPYPGPTIKATYFPNTSSVYWSSTASAGYPDGAWLVRFSDGYGSLNSKSNSYNVRCVRGGQYPSQSLINNGDGTVTDTAIGLMWQQSESGFMPWGDALSYCEWLSLANKTDWRLPNIKELASLTDDARHKPAIDIAFFPNTYSSVYWSSTTYASNPYGAWHVNFNDGDVGSVGKNGLYNVRCVRAGQTGSFGNLTVDPTSYDFGSVNVGSSSTPQIFTISNTGTANLVVGTITVTGTNANQFSKQNDNCSGQIITPSSTCTVQAVFSPTSAGSLNANLSIPSNASGSPTLVALSGTGTCTYLISTQTQAFGASGGTGNVGVTASDSNCNWTATSNDSWITITSGNSGSGNGTVNYSVSENTGTTPRAGTMTIAGQTFTVSQAGGVCSYSINPTSHSFAASGGTSSVNVMAGGGCSWTATSNDSWITITSGNSGSGSGTVNYSVSENTGSTPRAGTMTIAGQTFTVSQSASVVTVISPNGGEVIPSGSTYSIRWAPSNAVKFRLRYSINGGSTWKTIAKNVTGTSYSWTVPIPNNNKPNCFVNVTGYNASGGIIGEDTSDGPFTIEVVKVTSPDGGEVLHPGEPWPITWRTNQTIRPVASVKLYYSINGGASWKPIQTVVPNVSSSNCKVKVVLKDAFGKTVGSDVSDGVFTIQP